MLTYDLTKIPGTLYEGIYEYIKRDIQNGKLTANSKMPSKRAFAKNLGVSVITVENAYDMLVGEGYLYSLPKKGFYVASISDMQIPCGVTCIEDGEKAEWKEKYINIPKAEKEENVDFSFGGDTGHFPFSVWAKLMRETLSLEENSLLHVSPSGGVYELREAIANHLHSFRGVDVHPNQVFIGAGTEYLYSLLTKLLGTEKLYCVENPGYKKIVQIYESSGVRFVYADMDEHGMRIDMLRRNKAQIAHVSPTHHFPTGVTMPIGRRYELLSWAKDGEDRYIIEDDYDSEFRFDGRPIPPLMSLDTQEKVIYINTFSKSLTPTIRIAYMVLPIPLVNLFYERLSFLSCTVSTFEQYTLAKFICRGYFEKHINRMRLYYKRKRKRILELIEASYEADRCKIIENGSGLHFLLELQTDYSDDEVKQMLLHKGIRLQAITDYEMCGNVVDRHQFILDYSRIQIDALEQVLPELACVLDKA